MREKQSPPSESSAQPAVPGPGLAGNMGWKKATKVSPSHSRAQEALTWWPGGLDVTLTGFATLCYALGRSVVPDSATQWTAACQAPLAVGILRVGCHALLQRIFPTRACNPGLPHLQADSLPTEPPTLEKSLTPSGLSFSFCIIRGLN